MATEEQPLVTAIQEAPDYSVEELNYDRIEQTFIPDIEGILENRDSELAQTMFGVWQQDPLAHAKNFLENLLGGGATQIDDEKVRTYMKYAGIHSSSNYDFTLADMMSEISYARKIFEYARKAHVSEQAEPAQLRHTVEGEQRTHAPDYMYDAHRADVDAAARETGSNVRTIRQLQEELEMPSPERPTHGETDDEKAQPESDAEFEDPQVDPAPIGDVGEDAEMFRSGEGERKMQEFPQDDQHMTEPPSTPDKRVRRSRHPPSPHMTLGTPSSRNNPRGAIPLDQLRSTLNNQRRRASVSRHGGRDGPPSPSMTQSYSERGRELRAARRENLRLRGLMLTPQRRRVPPGHLAMSTPLRVKSGSRQYIIPKLIHSGRRAVLHTPEMFEKDKAREFDNVIRSHRPAANRHPAKKTTIGNFAVLEETGRRFHLEVQPGVTVSTARRIARIMRKHGKDKASVLNMVVDGRERRLGKLNEFSLAQLVKLLMAGKQGPISFVVLSEQTGGALTSPFWLHPRLGRVLGRKRLTA